MHINKNYRILKHIYTGDLQSTEDRKGNTSEM